MRTFVVDKSKWLRGEGGSASYLCRPSDGKMCILGLFGESLGIPRQAMKGQKRPGAVKSSLWPHWLFNLADTESPDSNGLIADNDAGNYWNLDAEQARQKRIRDRFAKHGIDVLFADPG